MRASSVVNCQSTFASRRLRLTCHAATSSASRCLESILRFRHCHTITPISTSATFSRLPCFGVYTKSNRSRNALASTASRVSYSAPGRWVFRLSITSVILRVLLGNALEKPGPVGPGAALGHFGDAPSCQGLGGHEHVAHLQAAVFVILARHLSGPCRQGLARLADQLPGRLVHADHWIVRVMGAAVHIQNLLHGGHEVGAPGWRNHPSDAPPGLDSVFFRTRRTVSWDTLSI